MQPKAQVCRKVALQEQDSTPDRPDFLWNPIVFTTLFWISFKKGLPNGLVPEGITEPYPILDQLSCSWNKHVAHLQMTFTW